MDAVMQTQKGAGLSPYVIACGQTRLEECPPQGSCGELRTVGWYELELMEDTDGGGVYTDGVFCQPAAAICFSAGRACGWRGFRPMGVPALFSTPNGTTRFANRIASPFIGMRPPGRWNTSRAGIGKAQAE